MKESTKGNLALLVAAIIWGSGIIAQKLGMSEIGPLTFNGVRMTLGGFVLLPIALRAPGAKEYFSEKVNSSENVIRRIRLLLIGSLVCGALLALGINLQQIGLLTVPAGRSGFITSIYIVLVPLFSAFFGDGIRPKVWFCIAMAMAGFAMLSLRSGFGNIGYGDKITFLGAILFSLQIIAVSRFVTKNNAVLLSAFQAIVSGIFSITAAFALEKITVIRIIHTSGPIFYSAVFTTAIAYTMQIIGQKSTNPTIASLIMSLEAPFSALFGVMLLGEKMSTIEWVGCATIFLAAIISQTDLEYIKISKKNNSKEDKVNE